MSLNFHGSAVPKSKSRNTPVPAAAALPRGGTSEARAPAASALHSIGTHGSGRLVGGELLPNVGSGFRVLFPENQRHYGNPVLVRFVEELSQKVQSQGLGQLRLGDLSQKEGGPYPAAHASHQSGLDVDIAYVRETPDHLVPASDHIEPVVVKSDGESVDTTLFGESQARVLEWASNDPRVERIFVNPVLKRELCRTHKNEAWLQKIRPWWGHDAHFHVRLSCPAGESRCRSAAARVPAGDGCDASLAWWFSDDARSQTQARLYDPLPINRSTASTSDLH